MLRLANKTESTPSPDNDCTCDWCGFKSAGDCVLYREGRSSKTACTICFQARHLLDFDRDSFILAWMPSMMQHDLNHLNRTIALIRTRLPADKVKGTIANAIDIAMSLRSYGEAFESCFIAGTRGKPVHDCWDTMSVALQDRILAGLRVLPVRFSKNQITRWADGDTDFSGYGLDHLIQSSWFKAESGLVEPETEPKAA